MGKITNSDWAVDASTITDSYKFRELGESIAPDDDGLILEVCQSYWHIEDGIWSYSSKTRIVNSKKRIITYNDFLTMFDKPKNDVMETDLMKSLQLAVEAAKIVYPDCVIKIEVSNIPIHEIGHAMNESNVKTQQFIDELPFNENGSHTHLIQLDATPEIRLISKPIK